MPILAFSGQQRAYQGALFGAGVPGYARHSGYTPSSIPTAVGARMFFPDPEYDGDDAVPAAMGNKWDGGRPAYRERVYAAAKKFGKDQGLSNKDIGELKPRVVA